MKLINIQIVFWIFYPDALLLKKLFSLFTISLYSSSIALFFSIIRFYYIFPVNQAANQSIPVLPRHGIQRMQMQYMYKPAQSPPVVKIGTTKNSKRCTIDALPKKSVKSMVSGISEQRYRLFFSMHLFALDYHIFPFIQRKLYCNLCAFPLFFYMHLFR